MEVTVVVDRIEGDLAVLEVGTHTVDWPRALLPAEAAEGATLSVVFAVQDPSTDAARERLERMRSRGPEGDDLDL